MSDESFISITDLEYIAKQVIPNIRVEEGRGVPNGTHCFLDGETPVLIWDSLTFEYYEKVIVMLDTFPYEEEKDQKIITEMMYNYMGIALDHISQRNEDTRAIFCALRIKANEFNYPFFASVYAKLEDASVWSGQYYVQKIIVAWLILYHELAHLLFKMDSKERNKWEELVIHNIAGFIQSGSKPFYITNNRGVRKASRDLLNGIKDKKPQCSDVIEELAADAFALSKTYATSYLNLHVLDKETLSDNIMRSYLRYVELVSEYGFMVDYWNELYSSYIANKRRGESDTENRIFKKSVLNTVRCGVYAVLSLAAIIQMDVKTWNYQAPKGISMADPRIQRILEIGKINMDLFLRVFGASLSSRLFNEVVKEAIVCDIKGINTFEYTSIPEDSIQITWLFVQLHNSLGLIKHREEEYDEAIKEFRLASAVSERYLGRNHRLTARAFNNICTCYLAKEEMIEDQTSLAFQECHELARYHSGIAIGILNKIEDTSCMNAGAIFQNLGKLSLIEGAYNQALEYFLKAKSIKDKYSLGYEETNAITDLSLSETYCLLNRFFDAKTCCEKALRYFSERMGEESKIVKETRALYEYIQEMFSPAGSIPFMISSWARGEKVDLGQLIDWNELSENDEGEE